MNRNLLIVYALCGILVATGIVYFLVAYGEYTDWVELLNFGIHDETTEKQVEITLFITSGLIYLGLVLWLIKTRFMKKSPYIAAIVVSLALIITYTASRTVGVPIVGVELLCWKTRRDFKNSAKCGYCTVLCWIVQASKINTHTTSIDRLNKKKGLIGNW